MRVRDEMTTQLSALTNLDKIRDIICRNGLIVINDSGGKDSQAMKILVVKLVLECGGSLDQILVVHADLMGVEWEGTYKHVLRYSEGLEVRVARAIKKDGSPKTLLGYWEERGAAPSPQQRWCTSDLKRGPIEKVIRHYIKEKGLSGLVLSCEGIRGAEGEERRAGMRKVEFKEAEKAWKAGKGEEPTAVTFEFDKRNSKAGREWYHWWPIFDFTIEQVFETISDAGQEAHWAYSKGMERLSCCFCIYAKDSDLRISAQHNPELFAEYVAMEKKTGFTLIMPRKGHEPRGLEEITGIKARVRLPVVQAA